MYTNSKLTESQIYEKMILEAFSHFLEAYVMSPGTRDIEGWFNIWKRMSDLTKACAPEAIK